MSDLTERVAALDSIESIFATVDIGDWGNGTKVPIREAIRILPAVELIASLTSAVQLAAQIKLSQGKAEEPNPSPWRSQLLSEIVDDWCGTHPPGPKFPPRPHWGSVVAGLARLSERHAPGSALREAAFELSRRVMDRAQNFNRQAK